MPIASDPNLPIKNANYARDVAHRKGHPRACETLFTLSASLIGRLKVKIIILFQFREGLGRLQDFTTPRPFLLKVDVAHFVDTKSLTNVPGLIP